MTAAATARRAAAPSADVFARTVPLIIERHYFGETKQAPLSLVEVANLPAEDQAKVKARLALSKRLLSMPETAAIRQRDTQWRLYLQSVATPFRPGFYLVPLGLVEQVDEKAREWERERAVLVQRAGAAYPAAIVAMVDVLKTAYNPLDYPPAQQFMNEFWIDWRFVDMGVPNVLREIRADVFERERAKAQAAGAKACEAIEQHLAGSLLKITDHVEYLLTPRANGNVPALREGALDKLLGFLDTLAARDVTDFKGLQAVAGRLRRAAQGLSIEALNDDDAVRQRTAAAIERAKADIEKLVTAETRRAIRLRDDGE